MLNYFKKKRAREIYWIPTIYVRSLSLNVGCYLLKINQPPSSTVKSCKTASDTGDCRRAISRLYFLSQKSVTCAQWNWMWSDRAVVNLCVAPWMRPTCEFTHRGGLVVKEVSGSRREEKRVMGREYGHGTLCTRMKLEKSKTFKERSCGKSKRDFGDRWGRLRPQFPC